VFGTGANCTTSGTFNGTPLNNSPIMAKFDYNDSGSVSSVLTGAAFPSITGSEFNLTLGANGFISYTYTPGAGDPLIQYIAVKGGNSFNLFAVAGSFAESNLFTPTTATAGNRAGVSHITFYDTALPPGGHRAEPMSLALFGAGLLGLGWCVAATTPERLRRSASARARSDPGARSRFGARTCRLAQVT
jgi:hypothetical protein